MFDEKQYWLSLGQLNFLDIWSFSIIIIFLVGILIILKKSKLSRTSSIQIIAGILVISLTLIALISNYLFTIIDSEGIKFGYYPYPNLPNTICWKDIDTCYVGKYAALESFGGWGDRESLLPHHIHCHTRRGDMGILIITKKHDTTLIGTQLPLQSKTAILKFKPI